MSLEKLVFIVNLYSLLTNVVITLSTELLSDLWFSFVFSLICGVTFLHAIIQNKKAIQKEITFYEKMLHKKSDLYKTQTVLEAVTKLNIEYYRQSKRGSSADWVRQWVDTCFPEAIKITVEIETKPKTEEVRILPIPALGECVEQEDSVV